MKTAICLFFVAVSLFHVGCAVGPRTTRVQGNHIYEGVYVNSMGNHFPVIRDNITVVNNYGPNTFVEFRREADVKMVVPFGQPKTFHPYSDGLDRMRIMFSSVVYKVDDKGNRIDLPQTFHQRIIEFGDRRRPVTTSWVVEPRRTMVQHQMSSYQRGYDFRR